MGERIVTLEDLLRSNLRAVCVGINPSPVSVEAGHYYQGRLGQRFFARLRQAGVIPTHDDGYEDDAAFAAGIGFTDIIKRPSARAAGVPAAEFEQGRSLLRSKLAAHQPQLVIFTFKKTAEVMFGRFSGNGFANGLRVGDSDVFVTPGPYEDARTAAATLKLLSKRLA